MDEPLQNQPVEPRPDPAIFAPNDGGKKNKTAMMTCIALGVLLAAALGLLAWLYMQSEADKKKLNDEKAQLQSQLDALNVF